MHEQEGPEGINEREESEEKDFGGFASKFIDFPTSREIGVVGLFSKVIMMVRVINSKADGGRKAHTDIAKDGHYFVDKDVGMSGPMSKVMNQYVAGVADGASKNVNDKSENPPWRILSFMVELL